MKFRYKGETRLENLLGFDWQSGDVHDVTDAYAIRKLSNNTTLFEVVDAPVPVVVSPAALDVALAPPVQVPALPKKRGPKPKLQSPEAE